MTPNMIKLMAEYAPLSADTLHEQVHEGTNTEDLDDGIDYAESSANWINPVV